MFSQGQPQRGSGTAMPSGWHQSRGDIHSPGSFVPCVLSCGRGHSSLSCDQAQATSVDTGAEPSAVLCSDTLGLAPALAAGL